MTTDARAALHEAYAAVRLGEPPATPIDPDRVVGVVGADVPDEAIRAAGLHPYRLVGRPGLATPHADAFMEQAIEPATRSILERLLDGTYAWLPRVVLCHDTEATVRLYQYLREIRRIEPGRGLPEPAFVEVLHQPVRTSTEYTARRMAGFVETLGEWTGTAVDVDALGTAIAASNRRREVMAELAARRCAADTPSGVDALAAVGAASFFPEETYAGLVRALIDDGGTGGTGGQPVRVFVTGSHHDAPGWYAAIEAAGAVIVGEDHAFGTAAMTGRIAEDIDPVTALTAFYHHRIVGSARIGIRRRAAGTVAGAIAARAEAVVCLLRHEDPAPHWDLAAQRSGLEDAGIPLHVIESTGYLDALDETQQAAIEGFLAEVVRARADGGAQRPVEANEDDDVEVQR